MDRNCNGLAAPEIGPADPSGGLPPTGHGVMDGGNPHQVQQDAAAGNVIIIRAYDDGAVRPHFFDDGCGVGDILQGVLGFIFQNYISGGHPGFYQQVLHCLGFGAGPVREGAAGWNENEVAEFRSKLKGRANPSAHGFTRRAVRRHG